MAKKPVRKSPRRSVKRKKKIAKRSKILFVGLIVLLMALLVGLGYYLGVQKRDSETVATAELFADTAPSPKQKPTEKSVRRVGFGLDGMMLKLHERTKEKTEKKTNRTALSTSGKRAKLVIIIDDVAHPKQLKAIKALPYKITPSIFPPSQSSRTSHTLAKGLKHFMVHLPLQSGEAKLNRMTGTLMVNDSAKRIRKRVKQIRKLFPHARFINNHTGSVFTTNYRAMKHLYAALRDEGFVFMDSRTGGGTKVKRIAKEYGDQYIVRDVFLDNLTTQKYIHTQLRKAVRIAKKRGYAIAIGHPRASTLRALRNAKGILRGVEVIYMDDLYR